MEMTTTIRADKPARRPGRRTGRLRLDPTATSGRWVVRDARGKVVTVSATAGSAAVLDDVNTVLSDAEAVLLT